MATTRLARTSPEIDVQVGGASRVARMPIAIRSAIPLAPDFQDRVRAQLANQIGPSAERIERATVRFEDVNGPKGGVDTICRIQLVVKGRPSIITEKRDTSAGGAFAAAVHAIAITIERDHDKHGH